MAQEIKIVVGNDKKPSVKKGKKVRKVQRKAPALIDQTKKVRAEIVELEGLKAKAGTGIRGFLRRAAIQKRIHDKGQFLSTKEKLGRVKQQTEFIKARTELEKAREEMKKTRKKTEVDFGGLLAPPKKIQYEDLFK